MSAKSIWAIGDIHGMLDPLRTLIQSIKEIEYERDLDVTLVFLGDYIDHGPSSKEVIDLLLELRAEGQFETVFMAGNHEDLLLQFLHGSRLFERYGNLWFNGNGGSGTVYSFMRSRAAFERLCLEHGGSTPFVAEDFELERKYRTFFEGLTYAHTETVTHCGRPLSVAFSHANLLAGPKAAQTYPGAPPPITVEQQLALRTYEEFQEFRQDSGVWLEDLHIWNRDYPTDRFGDYLLVHGHTPTIMLGNLGFELEAYDPASGLPFFIFTRPDVRAARDPDAIRFGASIDQVISVNIDTGLVYGKVLTALNFSEEASSETSCLDLLQIRLGASRRDRKAVVRSTIRFDGEGGQ